MCQASARDSASAESSLAFYALDPLLFGTGCVVL
nr:hypothetical protein [Cystobacter sp.]